MSRNERKRKGVQNNSNSSNFILYIIETDAVRKYKKTNTKKKNVEQIGD